MLLLYERFLAYGGYDFLVCGIANLISPILVILADGDRKMAQCPYCGKTVPKNEERKFTGIEVYSCEDCGIMFVVMRYQE